MGSPSGNDWAKLLLRNGGTDVKYIYLHSFINCNLQKYSYPNLHKMHTYPLPFCVYEFCDGRIGLTPEHYSRCSGHTTLNSKVAWFKTISKLQELHEYGECELWATETPGQLNSDFLQPPIPAVFPGSNRSMYRGQKPYAGETILNYVERTLDDFDDDKPGKYLWPMDGIPTADELIARLKRLMCEPRSLQQSCRLVIRSTIGPISYRRKVDVLPVPQDIKKYIKWESTDIGVVQSTSSYKVI